MTELYSDIPVQKKKDMVTLLHIISNLKNVPQAIKIIEAYRSTLTEYEQECFDFVFSTWREHESNSN